MQNAITEDKKRRVALYQKKGVQARLEYPYITDDEFDKSIKELAAKMGIDPASVVTYTLGTKDEMEEGTLYFCPRCGTKHHDGIEPTTSMFLKQGKDGAMTTAGYYKMLVMDSYCCNEEFEIHTDKWAEESEKLNKDLEADRQEESRREGESSEETI